MTKRERVTAAMNNRPVDRPPVGFWFHFPPEKALGQPCIDAHLAYYNNIGVDIAKLMCDGYFDYPNPVAKAAKEPATGMHSSRWDRTARSYANRSSAPGR